MKGKMKTYQLQVPQDHWQRKLNQQVLHHHISSSKLPQFGSNFIQFGCEFDAFSGDLLCQLPGDIRVRYLSWDLVENHHSFYDVATFRHVWYWMCYSFSIFHIQLCCRVFFPMFHSWSLSFLGFNHFLFLHCFLKSKNHPRTVEDAPVAFHARFSATGKNLCRGLSWHSLRCFVNIQGPLEYISLIPHISSWTWWVSNF